MPTPPRRRRPVSVLWPPGTLPGRPRALPRPSVIGPQAHVAMPVSSEFSKPDRNPWKVTLPRAACSIQWEILAALAQRSSPSPYHPRCDQFCSPPGLPGALGPINPSAYRGGSPFPTPLRGLCSGLCCPASGYPYCLMCYHHASRHTRPFPDPPAVPPGPRHTMPSQLRTLTPPRAASASPAPPVHQATRRSEPRLLSGLPSPLSLELWSLGAASQLSSPSAQFWAWHPGSAQRMTAG